MSARYRRDIGEIQGKYGGDVGELYDIPRKQASTSLVELSYDNLPTHCFGGAKALCVIALLPAGATKG